MIYILEHGNNFHTLVCPICGCKFSYETSDILLDNKVSNNNLSTLCQAYINCPECYSKIIINNNVKRKMNYK